VAEQRFGLGFDAHDFGTAGTLRLGGVAFDGVPSLAGHSDGDVVCHAVADALLGAAVMGDIGEHFPDTDPAIAGILGTELLARTVALIGVCGLRPWSADATVIAEDPPIAPRRDAMRMNLAETLGVPIEMVSVKATRPEGLGLSGGIGCLALAVVSVE
jgi:2-C-methyl-D-erythritol 2,4-cyclodiphosphate synthase